MLSYNHIGIIGGGKWATALAHSLSKKIDNILICSRNQQVVDSINNNNINQIYLPELKLSSKIKASINYSLLNNCDLVFSVIPTQIIADFFSKNKIKSDIPIILCNKGIDIESKKFSSQLLSKIISNKIYVLSGPNFAKEIAQNLPAASILAGNNSPELIAISSLINHHDFRCYPSYDIIGTEICGAIKNILAIACGIFTAKKLGENAKATLITMGIKEIEILIKEFNGEISTIYNLAGIGDIILTCNSKLSRNFSYGINLIEQNKLDKDTVEGSHTVKAVIELANNLGLKLPICKMIYNIIYKDLDIDQAIKNLFLEI